MATNDRIPLRLVLLGKTGVGKSATENTILGERVFESSVRAESVTNECSSHTKVIDQQQITIIDTPGLYDTSKSMDDIVKETVRGVEMMAPGPHAFLLVLDVRRHTEEERNTVKKFKEMFGDDVCNYMIVVFTHGDDLKYDSKTIDDFIRESGPELLDLVSLCGMRYHALDNRSDDRTQVDNFLQTVSKMLKNNGYMYYNYGLFKTVQTLKEKEKQLEEIKKTAHKLRNKGNLCSIL